MKLRNCETMNTTLETEGRSQVIRYEVFEMCLFDEDAAVEKALCGRETSATDRRGVRGYLEDRRYGNRVGAVCGDCKERAVPFIESMILCLEAEGRVEEADGNRLLAVTLERETGQDDSRGRE